MSYRHRPDGYDPIKWGMSPADRRRRSETRWLLLLGLVIVAAWPVYRIGFGIEPAQAVPNIGLLMPLILSASLSPFARENWLTARGRARYDEFERDAFARATTWAYALFLLLAVTVFAYLWAAALFGWPAPRNDTDWAAGGTAMLLIGAALPLAMAEFLVPLPPAEDEWD